MFATHPHVGLLGRMRLRAAEARLSQTFVDHTELRHQIEDRIVEGDKAGRAVVGDREAVSAEPRLDRRRADHRRRPKSDAYESPSHLLRVGRTHASIALWLLPPRISAVSSFTAGVTRCLPGKVYRNFLQLRNLNGGATMEQLKDCDMICSSTDEPGSR